jgi:hypothetical protein
VAVRVSKGDELTFGEPQLLFESQTQIGNHAAFPDGQRFIMFRGGPVTTADTVHIVENWDVPFRGRQQ